MKVIGPLVRSDGVWRERVGRVPSSDSVDPGLRVFPRTDDARLGPGADRQGLGRADGASRIRTVRRARRRLGCVHHAAVGAARAGATCSASTATCPGPFRQISWQGRFAGEPPPAGLSGDEMHAYEQLADFYTKHLGYAVEMANRPQTLYALIDSPVGLAAWILDHDKDSYEMIAPAFFGHPGGLSRDDVLDNITMYWLTKTAHLVGSPLLGEQARLLQRRGRDHPGRRERISARDLYGAAELVGESVSKTRLLQAARRGRALRRLGTAATFSEDVRATFRVVRPASS